MSPINPKALCIPVIFTAVALINFAAAGESGFKSVTDKTLVVWAAPANLTQRGGSTLTIDDARSHFDGVVFGELATGKWMPGSDFHRRTEKQQNNWRAETADANTFVQIAIAYHGKQISVYRNGELYAKYTMESAPQKFGPQSVIVIGKRHLVQGDDANFIGAIEDARIYDIALSAEQISELKANQLSQPKPIAWFDFQEGRAVDRTGTFSATTLIGDARIADGQLHLDKTGAYLVASIESPEPKTTSGGESAKTRTARTLREKLLSDPYRAGYHFVIPEGRAMPFDPNGAIFWKGRYHLFYIFQDHRGHNWGHVSSTDLFHWRHHPTGLVSGMFSGNCFINKDGRPTMCYHQVGQGNAMAVALDDELNEWEKLDSNPITPQTKEGDPHHGKYRSWDPFGWLEGDTYYAIFGGKRPAIAKAPTLGGEWNYVGDLLANTVDGISINEDVSCADFFKIGKQHMLLCISHRLGARYYLGDWKNEQFHPHFHEQMSWVDNSYFAPESLLDDKGRRIMWAWIFDGPGFKTRGDYNWSGTMSLPRVLTLGDDGVLNMNPPKEIERLRYNARKKVALKVEADSELVLDCIAGNSLELRLQMNANKARQYGVKVCRSATGQEQTLIYYDATDKKLKVDTTQSSLTDGPKSIEAGPFELKTNEPLELRVFIDKSVVEVFANGRQAVMRRIYPSRADSLGVSLFSNGGPVNIPFVEAWDMMPSNPY